MCKGLANSRDNDRQGINALADRKDAPLMGRN